MSKLIVLSVDSLFDEDMSFLKTLPNFGKLLSRAAYSRSGMRSIYPSFTYPAHASIITGTYPERHGIYHNEKLDVGNPSPDWFWYHRDLKVETCIDAAKRAGLTTAVIGWPCMGGCPTADYLVPEIWCKKENEEPHAAADTWSRRAAKILARSFWRRLPATSWRTAFLTVTATSCAAPSSPTWIISWSAAPATSSTAIVRT